MIGSLPGLVVLSATALTTILYTDDSSNGSRVNEVSTISVVVTGGLGTENGREVFISW